VRRNLTQYLVKAPVWAPRFRRDEPIPYTDLLNQILQTGRDSVLSGSKHKI
jgi:hypothetical protein